MASHADKGKEVVVLDKGLKRLRKGTKGPKSSTTKAPAARRFGEKVMEKHGLKWLNAQKEAKYAFKNLINEGFLELEFPTIRDTVTDTCLLSLRSVTSPWSFNAFFGTPVVDLLGYFILLEKPPYLDIFHTLYGEHSSSCWGRDHNDTHSTLLFSYLIKEARVWVKLLYVVLLPGTYTKEITRERVVLVYMLRRSRDNFCSEVKEPATSSALLLTPTEHYARDDSWRGRMFGMLELQLKIRDRPTTDEEMSALEERYPLTKSVMLMCKVGRAFKKPLDDDEPTILTNGVDDMDDDEDDDTIGAMQLDDAKR
ncbi:hypothetical protein HAX54_049455 [Datura stramonium]|uniref:Uncharacterized protein n=1 Tax=Datura stramonium TaxID=4076 RepID=A0ABS8SVS7_DATST|nr:hypothetical protein [Datura stramonium]